MIPVLYKPDTTNFTTFGEGSLSDALSCTVTEERNGVYECILKYPISGRHYDLISKEWIIKAKPNDKSNDQAFRIYRISKPLNGIVSIYAQHISYDLANVPAYPISYASATPGLIMSNLLTGDTRFTAWTDYSSTNAFSIDVPKSVRACLGGEENSLLTLWYGEYEWDNFTVKLHKNRGTNSGVRVEYGKNMTDICDETNNTSVYTYLLPYGIYTDESEVSHTVMLTEKTIELSTPASEMSRNKTLIVDLSDRFDGVITEEGLRQAASQYIDENNLTNPTRTITLSIYPIHQEPGRENHLDRIGLCDTVSVKYTDLGVSAASKVIKTEFDSLAEKYTKITLGSAKSNMISTISEVKEQTISVTEKINLYPARWERAIDAATALITGQEGGVVVLNTDTDGKPVEILIMDDPDIQEANNIWRWNMGGLGFSSNGYTGPYETAITSDGSIVADFINTGSLTANIISAGTLRSLDGTSWWDIESGDVHIQAVEDLTSEVSRLGTTLSKDITDTKQELVTVRDSVAGQITDTVEGYLVDEKGNALYATKTELSQSANELTASFTEVVNDINDDLSKTLHTYFQFSNDGLVIGKSGSDIRLKLINNEIDFIAGDESNVVAYFSNNKLYVTDAEFLSSIHIGNFAFTPRKNGNLSFGKVKQ